MDSFVPKTQLSKLFSSCSDDVFWTQGTKDSLSMSLSLFLHMPVP